MRKVMIVSVALVIGFILGAGVWGEVLPGKGFVNGNEYLSTPNPFQDGYIAGVSDAYLAAATIEKFPGSIKGTIKGPVKFSECVKEMTVKKIQVIVNKYLKDHPEDHHYGMAALVLKAVVDSCPEKSTP
jgi:hypothetical protein